MKARVFVAGDLMLDRFEYGKACRISPEAPVPVFKFEHSKEMLGGVGNVAANLVSLGCDVVLVGAVGRDASGHAVAKLLGNIGVSFLPVYPKGFPTIVKTRMIVGNNHLLRADREMDVGDIDVPQGLRSRMTRAISQSDVVLVSDYKKGFVSAKLCAFLIEAARKCHKPALVDPKGADWERYRGAALVKPNLQEFSLVSGRSYNPSSKNFLSELATEGRAVCKKFGIRNLLVTLSENGMILIPSSAALKPMHVPTEAKEVFDVSGAGDTALAALGAALGSGEKLDCAIRIANIASGIVVSKLGTATVAADELNAAIGKVVVNPKDPFSMLRCKLVKYSQLSNLAGQLRKSGKKLGFTNGCFDCCHLGHLYSILESRRHCDVLFVGLNSDKSVRKRKGPNRPIQDERTRAMVLAAMSMVDYIVVFDDDVPLRIVEAIRPNVIAKEGYPLDKWPEGRLVRKLGGKAIVLNRLEGYSTSNIVKRMEYRS